MKSGQEILNGIECLTVKSDRSDTAVVFLHGYGANMYDLFPLWEVWHEEGFDWYFPNGVMSLPMGHYEGRAWFSIDIEKLERAIREGTHRDMGNTIPPEFDSTLSQLEGLLLILRPKYQRLILGGFSQGAMCSSHLAMRESLPLDGLILLSGALLANDKFPKAARAVPFYQSHGAQDPILPASGGRELEVKLQTLNFPGRLFVFNGGHEIPPTVIQGVKSFIHSLPSAK
jgi:phospholipase/carboxylesterase